MKDTFDDLGGDSPRTDIAKRTESSTIATRECDEARAGGGLNPTEATKDEPMEWKQRLVLGGAGILLMLMGYFLRIGGIFFIGALLFILGIGMW